MFGNGSGGSGMVDVKQLRDGCSLLIPNPTKPPAPGELPLAIASVLQTWLTANPDIRVRTTLPVLKGGDMVALFVWWDRLPFAG
jgi:hypothetical protein